FFNQAEANFIGYNHMIEDPFLCCRAVQRFAKQIMLFDNLHTALTHLSDEVEMVALGVLHPQDVVKQELIAIGRCQSSMGQTWRANQDLAEGSNFGVYTVSDKGF